MPYSTKQGEIYRIAGLALKAEREVKGLTQKALARRVGIYPATLGALENGRNKLSLELLLNICAALDIDPVDVLRNIMRLNTKKPRCTCSAVPRETST